MSNTFDGDIQRAREWYIDEAKEKDWSHREAELSTLIEIAALLNVIGRDVRKLVEANEHNE